MNIGLGEWLHFYSFNYHGTKKIFSQNSLSKSSLENIQDPAVFSKSQDSPGLCLVNNDDREVPSKTHGVRHCGFCHPFGQALFPLSFEVMMVYVGFLSDRIQDNASLKHILNYFLHSIIFVSPIHIRSQYLFISFPRLFKKCIFLFLSEGKGEGERER